MPNIFVRETRQRDAAGLVASGTWHDTLRYAWMHTDNGSDEAAVCKKASQDHVVQMLSSCRLHQGLMYLQRHRGTAKQGSRAQRISTTPAPSPPNATILTTQRTPPATSTEHPLPVQAMQRVYLQSVQGRAQSSAARVAGTIWGSVALICSHPCPERGPAWGTGAHQGNGQGACAADHHQRQLAVSEQTPSQHAGMRRG